MKLLLLLAALVAYAALVWAARRAGWRYVSCYSPNYTLMEQ